MFPLFVFRLVSVLRRSGGGGGRTCPQTSPDKGFPASLKSKVMGSKKDFLEPVAVNLQNILSVHVQSQVKTSSPV